MDEQDETAQQNSHVLRLLKQEAQKRGHSKEKLAQGIGISYQRLHQYEQGKAKIADAKKDTLRSIGHYLGLPVVWIMLMTGHIGAQERAWPWDEKERRLSMAISHIRSDPWLGALLPRDIDNASVDIQEFVVLLYRFIRAQGLQEDSDYQALLAMHHPENDY